MPFIDPKKIPSLGNDSLDAAHRALAAQVNTLYHGWRQGLSADRLKRAFADLIPAVAHHFAEETALVTARGFNDGGAHAAAHTALLTELLEAVTAFIADDASTTAIDLFRLVETLLFEHEVLDDQDYWLLLSPVSSLPA